jgi:type IV secretory pathway VirD2 relaxase
LEREGVSREGEPGRLYSTFTDDADRDAFITRGLKDRHQFRIEKSLEFTLVPWRPALERLIGL